MDETDLTLALQEFVGAFEVVFRYDWEYTRVMIGDETDGANFIEPRLDDESEDWGARGALLEKYRALASAMTKNGLKPAFPFPLAHLPSYKGRVWYEAQSDVLQDNLQARPILWPLAIQTCENACGHF